MKKLSSLVGLVGIATIGGVIYANNRRGRQLTLDNLRLTALDLLGTAQERTTEMKDRAEKQVVHDVAQNLADATAPH
jgi:hypothetical protein